MLRSLKYKHFFNAIVASVMENLFRAVLRRFCPPASESKISGHGVFTFSDYHERLFEHLRLHWRNQRQRVPEIILWLVQTNVDTKFLAWTRTIFKAVHFKPQVCVRVESGDIRTRAANKHRAPVAVSTSSHALKSTA